MKVINVEAVPFELAYEQPFRMASGEIRTAEHVLIRVHTDDGLVGVGEAVSRPMIYGESMESIIAAVNRWFAPALTGMDPFRTGAVSAVFDSVVANNTAKGALDIALHDLRAIALDRPAWTLLGAHASRLRVTRMLRLGTVTQVVDEAVSAARTHGISSFKVKISNDVNWNVEILRELRRELGDATILYADANQALTLAAATETLLRTEDLGLDLFEEPLPTSDLPGRNRLASLTSIPLVADESAIDLASAGLQLVHGGARAVSIKTARTGFTQSTQIIDLATGLHARTVIGSQGDSALGATAAIALGSAHLSTAIEAAEVDYFLGLKDQIVLEVPPIIGGYVQPNISAPGVGARIDEEKLQHYRVDT